MFENISGIEIFLYVAICVTVVLLLLAKTGKISQKIVSNYGLVLSFGVIIYFLSAGPRVNQRPLSPPKYETGVSIEKIADKEAVRVIDGLEKRLEYFEEELEKTRNDLSALNDHHDGVTNLLAIMAVVMLVIQLGVGRKEAEKTDVV